MARHVAAGFGSTCRNEGTFMASVDQCRQALDDLAERLAKADSETKRRTLDRTVSCTLRDLNVIFAGQLRDGELRDIRESASASAQIRMTMTSDDLLKLVAGDLHVGSAWATGRIRLDASVLDLLRLRTVFSH